MYITMNILHNLLASVLRMYANGLPVKMTKFDSQKKLVLSLFSLGFDLCIHSWVTNLPG